MTDKQFNESFDTLIKEQGLTQWFNGVVKAQGSREKAIKIILNLLAEQK